MSQETKAIDELGAHVSAAGGVSNAPGRSADIDACVLQLFTKQPGRWAEPVLTPEEVSDYRAAVLASGIRSASSHDAYLINLASPDAVLRNRSITAFRNELERCQRLGIPYLVSHPGNATDGDFESGIARNADAVTQCLEETQQCMVLFETTAGAGRALGASFEQLAAIINRIPATLQHRIGVCLDTCHVWAAGYDLRNDYNDVMLSFDDTLGVHRIRMFHLNDSIGALGSRRDRHAHIGEGALGDDPFRRLLLDDRFVHVPKLLETPKDDDAVTADRRNLGRLRSYRM